MIMQDRIELKKGDELTEEDLLSMKGMLSGGHETFPSSLGDLKLGSHFIAFHRSGHGDLKGIGGLKRPSDRRKQNIFQRARSLYSPDEFTMELGWVRSDGGEDAIGGIVGSLVEMVGNEKMYSIVVSSDKEQVAALKGHGFRKSGVEIPSSRADISYDLFVRE